MKRIDVRLSLAAVGGVLRGRRGCVSISTYSKCGLVVAGYLRIPVCECCQRTRWFCGNGRFVLCSPRVKESWRQWVYVNGQMMSVRFEQMTID